MDTAADGFGGDNAARPGAYAMHPLYRLLALPVLAFAADASAQANFDCVAPPTPILVNPVVLGNGSPGSVTTAQLQAALDAGGAIRLAIGNSTLVVGSELRVTRATVLDAGGATLSGGNARRVLRVDNPSNATYTFDLVNATIANGSTPTGSGAGLWKPTGGPWQAVTIRVFHSRFSNNRATGTGGNPGNGGNAGAFGIDGADRFVNLCRTRILGNTANAYGGGVFTTVYDTTSFTRILDSTIADNTSSGSSNAHTGGVYLQGGPFSIRNSTFAGNSAAGYGGLSIFDHQTGTLIRASGDITSSTFHGNIARSGLGGAMNLQGSGGIVLQNLTIAGNRALCDVCFAAGIANGNGLPITLRNTIFADNTAGNPWNPWAILHPVAGSNNLQWPQFRPVSNQAEAAVTPGSQFADAGLGALGMHGGPTATMPIGAASPARDAGTATGATATDQRGLPRVGAVDVGAYEWQPDLLFANGFD